MNKAKRTAYSQLNSRRVKRWEGLFTKGINNILRKQVDKVVSVLKAEGLHKAQGEADQIIMIDGLAEAIRRLYVFVGLKSARRISAEIKESARAVEKKGFGFDEEWTRDIIRYFQLYLLDKAVLPISVETRRLILVVLDKGISEGWSIDQMADIMKSENFTLIRAKLIARTEIAKAQFYGEELGIENSEWETVETWISAHDHRVRSSHRKVDGDTIDSGGKFKVDRIRNNVVVGYDMMKGPGDPTASIENIANCRCVRSARAKRDERGRLIRKSKNVVALPA